MAVNVRRRGFTLIEILVTIGIILVLVGIASVGITYVTKAGKNNATKVTLANLRAMIAELEATAGLTGRQPASMWYGNAPATGTIDIWKDANPGTAPPVLERAVPPIGPVTKDVSTTGTVASNLPPRYNSDAVANTQLVMGLLLAVPKNRTAFQQLPAEQLMEPLPTGVTDTKLTPTPIAVDRRFVPALPLDAWGNPIIFVPSAGMLVVRTHTAGNIYAPGHYVSAGTTIYRATAGTTLGPPGADWEEVPGAPMTASRDSRPFFASAGPDGDFLAADDNLYSFEN